MPTRCARQVQAAVLLMALAVGSNIVHAAPEHARRRVQFNRGIVAFYQRDYSAAEAIFASLVQSDPTDAAAVYWLGLCQLQSNNYASAAQSFQAALQLEPQRQEVQLDYAIALVGQDRYDEAREVLAALLADSAITPANRTLVYYFLGVAEYRLANLDPALAALDAAETMTDEPSMLANIAWFQSWIAVDQRRLQQAAEGFLRVSELSNNVDQVARARSLAEEIDSGAVQVHASQLQMNVELGWFYDTNVILLGEDTSVPVGLSTDNDVRFGLSSDISVYQPLGSNWLVGLGGNTFHSWHPTLQEYNVQTYGGQAFVNYFAGERVTLGMQYEYDYTLVNNNGFLARHRITPSLRLVEGFHDDDTPLTATTAYYSYEPRDYQEALEPLRDFREDRDGNYHTVGIVQSFNLVQPRAAQDDPRWLSAALGYRFLNNSTQGDDFDLTGHGLSARLEVPLPGALLFEFTGQWSWEHYWQPNTQDFRRRNREDFIQQYICSLSREVQLDPRIAMQIRGGVALTIDDSNVRNRLGEAIYSYDRVIYGVTLSFFFQ